MHRVVAFVALVAVCSPAALLGDEPHPSGAFAQWQAKLASADASARARAIAVLTDLLPDRALAVPRLAEALGDSNHSVRRNAAAALVETGPAALPDLIACLESPDGEVRLHATEIIRAFAFSAPAAVDSLVVLLGDEDPAVREAATATLQAIGPVALPASIVALRSSEAEVRLRAAEVIRPFGSKASAAVESLTALLNDEDAPIRQAAAATLETIGEAAAPAADCLNALLYDEDADVRRAALCALGRIDGFAPDALPALEAYGEGWQPTGIRPAPGQFEQSAAPDEAMLVAFAGIFVLRPDRISLARLSAAVAEQPEEFRAQLGRALVAVASGKSTHPLDWTAALAVARAGLRAEASDDRLLRRMSMYLSTPTAGSSAEKVAWAARWLQDPDVAARSNALQSLRGLNAESRIAAPLWVKAIEDDNAGIRRQAALAMGAMQDPTDEVFQALAQGVRDADERVRFEAVNALGEIGRRNEVVEDALEEAMQDRVPSVRETAVWARRQIVTSRPQAE